MAKANTYRKYGKDRQRGNITEIEREYREDMRLGHKPTQVTSVVGVNEIVWMFVCEK